MKEIYNLIIWIALYFIRLPHERIQLIRPLRLLNLHRQPRGERRIMVPHHQIGDRRRTWFENFEARLGIEPPSSTRDLRVNIVIIVATIQVVVIILATARVKPENMLLIPTFCLYAAFILAFRQYRLNSLASSLKP